jgi:hypothetical protein
MTAAVFLIRAQSLASTRREEPHAEHVNSRGKLSAAARPTWPQGQAIRSIIGCLLPVDFRRGCAIAEGGSRAAEAAPQFQLTGLISTFGTNNWPARAIISCRSFDVRCWQMRTFQLSHFGSE